MPKIIPVTFLLHRGSKTTKSNSLCLESPNTLEQIWAGEDIVTVGTASDTE